MTPFRAPTDDILASLRRAARGEDWDADVAAEVIGHFAAFAEGVLAPLDAPGDAQGCRLDGGRVRMPNGFPAAYAPPDPRCHWRLAPSSPKVRHGRWPATRAGAARCRGCEGNGCRTRKSPSSGRG